MEKLCHILDRENKKYALRTWKSTVDLWKLKISRIKKLLQWNKLKITSKVLNKWYSDYKLEQSMFQTVSHRDYVISMYEIMGNLKNANQFKGKYHSMFAFMVNRYLKQWLSPQCKSSLKRAYLSLKKDKNSFMVVDLSEPSGRKHSNVLSPVRPSKPYPEYANQFGPSKYYLLF